MAAPKRRAAAGKTARTGKKPAPRKVATVTVGARLDAAIGGVRDAAAEQGRRWAARFRSLTFLLLCLTGLAVAGIVGGYWMSGKFDDPPAPGRSDVVVAKPAPSPDPRASVAPKPTPEPQPKYARIEELPDLPRYSEAEGRSRPVFEERPPAVKPRPAPAEQSTWRRNAIPFRDDSRKPLIVVVIDDMGVDRARSRRITELPAPLTLSYLPYARDLREQAQAGRGRGHELMLHLPMEPMSGAIDPGPNALLTTLTSESIRRRTMAALESFEGFVAVNNHMGSRFTTWRPGVETSLREIRARGVAWLDSRTSAQSVAAGVAEELAMPHLDRHVFLDDVAGADHARQQLAEVERLARRQGFAIAIGHPHDATIEALAEWLPGLRGKGFVQGPISAAIRRRGWE